MIKKIIEKLFKKKIVEVFKQECSFVWDMQLGDKKIFKMQSSNIYLAELIEIDSSNYCHTADDTGLRDLYWKILDNLEIIKDYKTDNIIIQGKTGNIELNKLELRDSVYENEYDIINKKWINKYYPNQNKKLRIIV